MTYRLWLYHEDKQSYNLLKTEIQRWLAIFQPSYFITNSQDFCHDFITELIWSTLDGDNEETMKERLRKILRGYTYLQYEGKVMEYKDNMVNDDTSEQ